MSNLGSDHYCTIETKKRIDAAKEALDKGKNTPSLNIDCSMFFMFCSIILTFVIAVSQEKYE